MVFLLFVAELAAQKNTEFGALTSFEKDFIAYEKDTTATAVYLSEFGDNYFEIRHNKIWLVTKYHAKIKVLKKEGFDYANIQIPYYHNSSNGEQVLKIRAITHNDALKTGIRQSEIYKIDLSENWSAKKFTFPNIKVGSVLEYSYETISPFFFNLKGWDFQEDIPKIYTEYNAKIPGNWIYNRSLIGELELDINDASVKKYCFSVPGVPGEAACEVLRYAMKDVPAFKKEEEYMLGEKNYRSRLEFELSEYHNFYREKVDKFTKTWRDVDREFRADKDIGRQLKKKNFFENNVSEELLQTGGTLERAKKIYAFVQNHFAWDGKYGIWRNNRVKKAFEERKGNVAEINIALINLLNAANINADMMLMATREFGLPKKSHPVMSDFNYIIAKVEIDGKSYLLDASEKDFPFGVLPFRCLNYYGRVMDYEESSYWYDIKPQNNNKRIVRGQMLFDELTGVASGKFNTIYLGYEKIWKERYLAERSEDDYLDEIESSISGNMNLTSYSIDEKLNNEQRLAQKFEFSLEDIFKDDKIFFDPIIVKFFDENPFKSNKRFYPIDFGYVHEYGYSMYIKVPKAYSIISLPEKEQIMLSGNSGSLRFECKLQQDNTINVFFKFKINATQYKAEAYQIIKNFFESAVQAQNKSYIILEKV